jgi:uncharacterized OB-fold protein
MTEIRAILPRPTAASQPFWDGCNRGEFLLSRCTPCGHVFYYPRIHCPQCGARELGWLRCSGRGMVFSFTHVGVSFHGPGWESQLPYTVLLVDLEEGPRMMSRLVGNDRDAVAGGDRVELVFVEIDGQRLPFFQRASNKNGETP